MFPYIALAENLPWQPGPYPGVELKILHRQEATGGLVVLRKFRAGQTIPAHTHPTPTNGLGSSPASGRKEASATPPGTLFHAPKGVLHDPHIAKSEVISLTVFDGPLTVA